MTYNIFNNTNINSFKNKKNTFFCKICNKTMSIYSRYKHFKTMFQILLSQKGNAIDNGQSKKK